MGEDDSRCKSIEADKGQADWGELRVGDGARAARWVLLQVGDVSTGCAVFLKKSENDKREWKCDMRLLYGSDFCGLDGVCTGSVHARRSKDTEGQVQASVCWEMECFWV